MSDRGWPICTTAGCGHEMIHGSSLEASAFAREHMNDYVDRIGDAVCECHPRREAGRLGVKRFNCGNRPAPTPPVRDRAADTEGPR